MAAVVFTSRCFVGDLGLMHFCCATVYISAAYAVVQCPSVCPSVCHVRVFCHCILKLSTAGYSHAVLVFPYHTLWQYPDGESPNNKGRQIQGRTQGAGVSEHSLS